MSESLLFRSLGISAITGAITESLKIFLIYTNVEVKNVLFISIIFSYSISYVAQRYVFAGGRFFGLSLLKYCAIALITIQITQHFLTLLQNNKTIKSFIEDKDISETRRKIYKYILINTAILSIFFCIDYPLRKSFIFIKNKETDYTYSYILYSIAIIMYICYYN